MAASQTQLVLTNDADYSVQVYITLGAVAGCVQNVSDIPFVTNVVNNLQGWFTLGSGDTVSYTPAEGVGIDGNYCFGSPPLNCPTDDYPDGVNLAEFNLNIGFQPGNPQESIDVSAVTGVNAFIKFSMSGGGAWNASSAYPNVTEFENKRLKDNCGVIGVYPYGCDGCTERVSPPDCSNNQPPPPPYGNCQSASICQVQRDASEAGGMVVISFKGFTQAVS
jgi:hypothetical protein